MYSIANMRIKQIGVHIPLSTKETKMQTNDLAGPVNNKCRHCDRGMCTVLSSSTHYFVCASIYEPEACEHYEEVEDGKQ